MKIYNTLTHQVEEIVPLEANKIKMYSCGPTVYRFIHIGNLRTFTMADWLRRAFEYRGYEVLHIKNITDVGHMRQEMLDRGEDKMIAQARKEGRTSAQIARFYTEAFHDDEAKLNILPAHIFPRATQHIPEMLAIISGLIEKGVAYEVNGSVYFDIKRFPEYGKLSGNQLENMLAGVRDAMAADRHNPEDFPLWKLAEPGREMVWESPWSLGFPGWHIECSAMSMKYLGQHFDIHTGGVDNIFPHHEGEIAQSEAFTGEPLVNYWVHAQHLLADGQKMAKSTGNAYTCSEIEARGFDPMALRYFYTTALFRSRLNFTFRALQAAQTALDRLRDRAYRLFIEADKERLFSDEPVEDRHWRDAFLTEVENDLNMPRAMSVVWSLLHSNSVGAQFKPVGAQFKPVGAQFKPVGAQFIAPEDATTKLRLLLDFDRILGFDLKGYLLSERPQQRANPQVYLAAVPAGVAAQLQERGALRDQQQYPPADQLRQELRLTGYDVRDTERGSLVLPRRPEEEFLVISSSKDAPDYTQTPDQFEFSINLLAHNNCEDLERCIQSICRHSDSRHLELVIVDNGSTDETLPYLQQLARSGDLVGEQGEGGQDGLHGQDGQNGQHRQRIALQVLFADHNMGFAAGRNATMRASRGHYIVLMDTSIEIKGDIWTQLANVLADRNVGLTGPYGLVTQDLREFSEPTLNWPGASPDVDAVEGYLMAFRRKLLPEIGWIDEKFRFYRLMDIHLSFFIKAAGYRVFVAPQVAALLEKHPHREWFSLSEDERATKSKKNYDIFRARWHHGESLLVANYNPNHLWRGHDHPNHLEGTHTHDPEELPAPGVKHTHTHQHWPDHAHEHAHYHAR